METFNFPYHRQRTEYPQSGNRIQLGNGYVFTSPPNAPDLRTFTLSFPTMKYFINDEPTATNFIPNSVANGDTIATMPSWNVISAGPLTYTLVGKGYDEDLEPYVDIRISGTNDTTARTPGVIIYDNPNFPTVAQGQTWAGSIGVKLIEGTLVAANATRFYLSERNSSNAVTSSGSLTIPISSLSTKKRYSVIRTLVDSTTVKANPYFSIVVPASASIDVTLRFTLPQLERDRVTSPIWTTTGPVTRVQGSLDKTKQYGINMAALEAFYNEHKLYKPFIYPHPVYGNIEARFMDPLKIPEGIVGGNGALEDFNLTLIENNQ